MDSDFTPSAAIYGSQLRLLGENRIRLADFPRIMKLTHEWHYDVAAGSVTTGFCQPPGGVARSTSE